MKRKVARAEKKALVQASARIEEQTGNTYVGKGGCLIPHFPANATENIPPKNLQKRKSNAVASNAKVPLSKAKAKRVCS